MAATSLGPYEVRLGTDEKGHDTYTVKYKVRGIPGVDGPANAKNAIGLPVFGQMWDGQGAFANDVDTCAWCRATTEVEALPGTKEGEKPEYWSVTKYFSSAPQETNQERCDFGSCNPLDEPQKISIEYGTFTEEGTYDRFGRRIKTSSHEPIHGPTNEWEFTKTSVKIVQNVEDPQLSLLEQIKDNVNSIDMWGLPPRTIKFRPGGLERHFRIVAPGDVETGTDQSIVGTCECYWTRTLIFDIKFRRLGGAGSSAASTGTAVGTDIETITAQLQGAYETWDRNILDEGTKVLRGYFSNESGLTGTGTGFATHWTLVDIDGAPPNPNNPQHFIRFKDWNGENQKVLLDGAGKPAGVPYIVYQWWVVRETIFSDGGDTDVHTIMKLPCEAVKQHVAYLEEQYNIADVDFLVVFFGPFDSQSEAEASLGPSGSTTEPHDQNYTCDPNITSVGVIHVERYPGSDLLRLLGVPEDFTLPLPPYTSP